MKIRITGGRKGLITAIDEAYRCNAINPTVRYSHDRGFYVESGIHPAADDVLWQRTATISANTGRYSVEAQDYPEIREAIES